MRKITLYFISFIFLFLRERLVCVCSNEKKKEGEKYQVKSLYINLISYFTCYIDQNLMRGKRKRKKNPLCASDNALPRDVLFISKDLIKNLKFISLITLLEFFFLHSLALALSFR